MLIPFHPDDFTIAKLPHIKQHPLMGVRTLKRGVIWADKDYSLEFLS